MNLINEFFDEINITHSILESLYIMNHPSQPIQLYDGKLEIFQKGSISAIENKILGHGKIEIFWFPRPHIKFKICSQNRDELVVQFRIIDNNRDEDTYLKILESGITLKARINSSFISEESCQFSGRIIEPISEVLQREINYSIFHILNFNKYIGKPTISGDCDSRNICRVEFIVDNWRVTIDQVQEIDEKINLLNSQGGFLITHVGKLEKLDSGKFSVDEAKNFLLGEFKDSLSLARGLKVPVIGLSGYSDDSQKVWNYWDLRFDNSWKSTDSWFPSSKADILAEVLPGFIQWLRQEKDAAETALYSYLAANANEILEIRVILIQAALETLSHTLSVDNTEISSNRKCKRLKAAEKMRKLCAELKIPTDLPPPSIPNKSLNRTQQLLEAARPKPNPTLDNLVKAASQHSWKDGPHAITAIRNDIVHGKKKYDVSWEIMNDAANLGLWYLEMVFLAKAGYHGKYQNRLIRPRQYGEMEPVPWSQRP
jgi:hypothetical protein